MVTYLFSVILKNIKPRMILFLPVALIPINAFAKHEFNIIESLLPFLVVGLVSAVMLGGLYLLLIVVGKSNLKKSKTMDH